MAKPSGSASKLLGSHSIFNATTVDRECTPEAPQKGPVTAVGGAPIAVDRAQWHVVQGFKRRLESLEMYRKPFTLNCYKH